MSIALRTPAAALLLSLPGLLLPSLAHAHLRQAEPPVGGTVRSAPAQVDLTFSEAVEPRFSTVAVTDAAGAQMDKHDLHAVAGDGMRLAVSLGASPPGTYNVSGAAAPHSPGSADHAALRRWTMCCGPGSRLLTVRVLVRMVVGAHGAAGCRPSPTATGAGCGQGGGIVGVLV